MRIVQISDLHIPHSREFTHDIPIKDNFKNVLEHIKKQEFDVLIISGDLYQFDNQNRPNIFFVFIGQ